jgi:DNA-binding GntR family transcriptional regulator
MPEPTVHLASVNEQVVSVLREMILAGTLAPGARLPEIGLSRQFGVSRNTIREAVRAVAREGLVNLDRNKTATVAELSVDDVADLYAVRRLLELSAVAHLDAAVDADVAGVDAAYAQLTSVVASAVVIDDWAAICEADLDFHKSIVGLHASPRLSRAFQAIRYELSFCLTLITAEERRAHRTDRLTSEHDEIRRAVVDRDSALAERLIRDHLEFYEAATRSSLDERHKSSPASATK